MNRNMKIAIDGPAGAGKSTVAQKVAKELDILYIDTGAIYRAVTLAAVRRNIDLGNEDVLSSLAEEISIEMVQDNKKLYRIFMDGSEVTEEIRKPQISRQVSQVAKIPGVRESLLEKQRDMASLGGVVMEGRDIGTKVFPEADFKFFLTAAPEERARRRYNELVASGYQVDWNTLLSEIKERDRIDSTRKTAPLVPAPNAMIIDCSQMNIEEVVDIIVSRVTGR
ncbi:MAG: (d)CMP kinase [Firmicutes bacterium]|nr:(d)CMP kinase [Bacillota bacterium]